MPEIEYGYDAREQRARAVHHPKDLKVDYGYDRRGFLISEVWSQLPNGTNVYTDKISYDLAGNRTRRDQNGALTTYTTQTVG